MKLNFQGIYISEALSKNNNNLDLIRILAALLVVLGHCYKLYPATPQKLDIMEQLIHFSYFGSFAVKIFFFVSGMLVTNSLITRRSLSSFIVSRFFRIMPGLFAVLFCTAFVLGPFITSMSKAGYLINIQTWTYFLKNIAFSHVDLLPGVFCGTQQCYTVNGSLWTLRFEMACYVFLLLFFFLVRGNKKVLGYLCWTLIIAYFAFDYVKFKRFGDFDSQYALLASFVFGALFAVYKDKIRLNYLFVVPLLVINFVIWSIELREIFFYITTFYVVLLFATNDLVKKIKVKYDISYGVYIWGFLIQRFIIFYYPSINFSIYIVLSLAITIIFGLLSFLLVEKQFIEIGKKTDKFLQAKFQKLIS